MRESEAEKEKKSETLSPKPSPSPCSSKSSSPTAPTAGDDAQQLAQSFPQLGVLFLPENREENQLDSALVPAVSARELLADFCKRLGFDSQLFCGVLVLIRSLKHLFSSQVQP